MTAKNDRANTQVTWTLEALVGQIEEDIILGELHPNQKLVEEDAVARFGVSRHALRQALVELERMGLVQRVPNKGTTVRSYSTSEVSQLYQLREVLESKAIEIMPLPVSDSLLSEIERAQQEHDKAVAEDDFVAIYRANFSFHQKFFRCCGNPFLVDAITDAARRARGVRYLVLSGQESREVSRVQHHQLIDAVKAGDRAAIHKVAEEHRQTSFRVAMSR